MAEVTKAHQRYRNANGTIVPGVTTILALLAKPALIHWAWKLGMEGLDYKKVSEKAANIGTIAHYLIECHIKGIEPDLSKYAPADVEKAENAYLAFLDWEKGKDLTTVESEAQLVSEGFQYGGALDWVVKSGSDLWLIDFKTSKAVYPEMLYQLAAYWRLWSENHPGTPIVKAWILLLGKEDGNFSIHEFKDLTQEFEIFAHLRAVYALRKTSDPNRNDQRQYKIKGGD